MINVDLPTILTCIEKRQAVRNRAVLDGCVVSVCGVASLDKADKHKLSFLANARYQDALKNTHAGVVLVDDTHQADVPSTAVAVVVSSPYLAYACVSQLFDTPNLPYIHPTAVIDESVQLGEGCQIGAYAVIGAFAVIGDGCRLGAGVSIGVRCQIGNRTMIDNHAVIAPDCVIGEDCRIHAHATIGSEGFGFAPTANPAMDGWVRIAQLGRVVIGNRVRIGSQTCIDRGAIDDTLIDDDVIIDNLVQIAHNVHVGRGTAIAAKVGIAGSTKIGKGCVIGGAAAISGHLTIADFVCITATTFVIKSIDKSGTYSSGTTAMPNADWRRAAVKFRQMGER